MMNYILGQDTFNKCIRVNFFILHFIYFKTSFKFQNYLNDKRYGNTDTEILFAELENVNLLFHN